MIYVTFYKFDTLVKFHHYSFIGCQEICESALHWFKLEVLPKKVVVYKWGLTDLWNEIIR